MSADTKATEASLAVSTTTVSETAGDLVLTHGCRTNKGAQKQTSSRVGPRQQTDRRGQRFGEEQRICMVQYSRAAINAQQGICHSLAWKSVESDAS